MIPQSLGQETLQKIHSGHQGIQRCCLLRFNIRLVAWYLTTGGASHQELPRMCQGQCASRTADDCLTLAKPPMGEGDFQPVSTEWEDLTLGS